jgi:hypothetical protein
MPKRTSAQYAADMLSCDAPSTSYPTTSLEEEWDVLGACMTTAQEMEACVDHVVSCTGGLGCRIQAAAEVSSIVNGR